MAKSPKSLPIQAIFIQKLKEALPPNVGLAEEMADTLDISTDSAYRRIRGETDLSIDETFTLAKKYAISVDSVFSHHNDTVTFTYTKLIDSAENFERYLSRLCNHLKLITTFDLKKVCYMAEELPIFYSMFTDKLAEFKLFYWQRSVLNIPDYQGRKFEYGLIPERQLAIAREMLEVYKTVPSMEIWTNETILTATKQVEYYYDSGVVSREISVELLGEIRSMVLYVQECAEKGRKNKNQPEDSYTLYNSDVVLGTNCIYVQTGDAQYAYVSFNTLNSLTTNNREFCEETEHWVRNIEKKSTLISGVAEKQRFQFFHKMLKHIDASIERVQQN